MGRAFEEHQSALHDIPEEQRSHLCSCSTEVSSANRKWRKLQKIKAYGLLDIFPMDG